jgi:hypothetical protein
MAKTTVTEAMAELKLIAGKVNKKREFVLKNIARIEKLRDPLEKDGGSPEVLAKEMQAVKDLEERFVKIRQAIWRSNLETKIEICGVTRTITEWLAWRREIAQGNATFLANLASSVASARSEARKRGVELREKDTEGASPDDVVIHVNEMEIQKDQESVSDILAKLDGQLSVKNATVAIEIE